MSHALSAEIELALACCRWPRTPEACELVRETAARVSDWELFDAIVRRNRITPLVHDALMRAEAAIPADLRQELGKRGLAVGQRALAMARESLALQRAFDQAEIPFMILKGVPVGILAYGQIAMKESSDIDFLVAPDRAVDGLRLLAELGYALDAPQLEIDEFARFVEFSKEAAFRNPRLRWSTELHWRLVDQRTLMRGATVAGPAQTVDLPGGSLRTLADEPLFAFLCLHGAAHNWGRLKWLADFNAFAWARGEARVLQLLEAAEGYGAGRSASVAIGLCARLFGRELGAALTNALERSTVTRALEDNAIAGLAYRGGGIEPPTYSSPWARTKVAQYFLDRGIAHVLEQTRIDWTVPSDRARMALPRSLSFVHHLIRVPVWLGRVGRVAIRRITT